MLNAICRGLLGERGELYWPVFTLQYRTRGTEAHKVYAQLEILTTPIKHDDIYVGNSEVVPSIAKALKHASNVRRDVEKKLIEAVKSVKPGAKITFADGEVLLDMPPTGKDQVENVFIWDNNEVRKIENLSPVADAVKNTFRYWVRRPRVFLAPQAWNRFETLGIDLAKLQDQFYAVLGGQLSLPFKQI